MSNCARSFNFQEMPDWFSDSVDVFLHVRCLPGDNPTVRRAVRQACLRNDGNCDSCRMQLEETFHLASEMVECGYSKPLPTVRETPSTSQTMSHTLTLSNLF